MTEDQELRKALGQLADRAPSPPDFMDLSRHAAGSDDTVHPPDDAVARSSAIRRRRLVVACVVSASLVLGGALIASRGTTPSRIQTNDSADQPATTAADPATTTAPTTTALRLLLPPADVVITGQAGGSISPETAEEFGELIGMHGGFRGFDPALQATPLLETINHIARFEAPDTTADVLEWDASRDIDGTPELERCSGYAHSSESSSGLRSGCTVGDDPSDDHAPPQDPSAPYGLGGIPGMNGIYRALAEDLPADVVAIDVVTLDNHTIRSTAVRGYAFIEYNAELGAPGTVILYSADGSTEQHPLRVFPDEIIPTSGVDPADCGDESEALGQKQQRVQDALRPIKTTYLVRVDPDACEVQVLIAEYEPTPDQTFLGALEEADRDTVIVRSPLVYGPESALCAAVERQGELRAEDVTDADAIAALVAELPGERLTDAALFYYPYGGVIPEDADTSGIAATEAGERLYALYREQCGYEGP